MNTMIRIAFLVAFSALSGCAVVHDRETLAEEAVYAGLHLVDGAQTAQIQNTPNVVEGRSAWAIGAKPSTRSTMAYFALSEAVHVGIADAMLAHHWPRWTVRVFEALTVTEAATAVSGNFDIGLQARF